MSDFPDVPAPYEMDGATYYPGIVQGSDEWHAARCGLLTASTIGALLTPTGKFAVNDKVSALAWELLAQRITGYVEPSYVGDAIERGWEDENTARDLYARHYAPVETMGFVVRDFGGGVRIGYSPDGMVGRDGLIESKSRRQRFQSETIATGKPPAEYLPQMQAGMMVTGRLWCDFISYSGGMPMIVYRVHADPVMQANIMQAAADFEARMADARGDYDAVLAAERWVPTERRIELEMHV